MESLNETDRTTVFDRKKLPESGCRMASFNAKFYASDH
jgi:hypothetical protein